MLLLTTTGRRFGPAAAVARLSSSHTTRRSLSAIPNWATLDPASLGARNSEPYAVSNIVNGLWCTSNASMTIPNPMDKDAPPGKLDAHIFINFFIPFLILAKLSVCTIPDTQANELEPFIASLKSVPKSGVHNPLKNNERYLQFGEISRKVRR